ncbi:MAG: 16S rRNA processing protein RimM [Alphaproteobacteria bacterium]|nr:MAG: 16S rRNA processing protein RimM [Alphaproteobacteria bacterium]
MTTQQDERICVGAVAGAYGVRGEARIKSFCARPEDIGTYRPLYLEGQAAPIRLRITRPVKGGFAARIEGVRTREEAEALRGRKILVDRETLPTLPDDEFYHADLIGLEAVDTGGAVLGRVRSVQNHGAGDLLEIAGPNLRQTVLVPFTRAIVPTVDLTGGRVVIDPPAGLFDDGRKPERGK